LLTAISSLTGIRLSFHSAMLHAQNICRTLHAPLESDSLDGPFTPDDMSAQGPVLSLSNVSFEYPSTGYGIHNVTMDVRRGELLSIVGGGGTGKSTLLAILFKLLPYDGSLKLFGHELSSLSLRFVRRAFGFMTQFPFFFHRSLMENILYGTDERGEEANKHAMVSSLPAGYDTIITARGQNLSGSQQKRLALCRAQMRNPDLLLLDEPLSGLSRDQARHVMAQLVRMKGKKTVIMVTHELELLSDADRIVVFDRVKTEQGERGVVSAIGTYDELVAKNHVFRRLRSEQELERLGA
jgi:ABC-type multidrug transport system fused ATPase/permease subunit